MTAIVSDYKDVYFHREYQNDWNPKDTAQRVAVCALPFLSLYRPFQTPISLASNALRTWSSASELYASDKEGRALAYQMAQTGIAIISLAGAILSHPAGMILTTAQDISLESKIFLDSVREGKKEQALKSSIKILNNAAYLLLMTRGGLELSIVSLSMQAVVLAMSSLDEFKEEHYIEACSHFLMAGIRLNQGYSQYQLLQRKWEIEAAIRKAKVGELHGEWQFPSDHLPVGVEVDGVRIISWNVLNDAYVHWITEKDTQGLSGSLIDNLNIKIDDSGLTERDVFIANMIASMTSSGQVIALQECGTPFLSCLEEKLPEHWQTVKMFDAPKTNQEVILYDTTRLTYQSKTDGHYEDFPNRLIQQASFSRVDQKGADLSIINGHIPGNPELLAREDFAKFVYETHKEDKVTVALGDNNFEREEMLEAYRKAGFSEFSLHSPWKSNIEPYTQESKAIDHIFIDGASSSKDLSAKEILDQEDFKKSVDLLNPSETRSSSHFYDFFLGLFS